MASVAINNSCKECQNGVATCTGCEQHFCMDHFLKHRQELDAKMDEIGQKYNNLQQDLEREESAHAFSSRFKRRKQESVETIDNTAEQAPADVQDHLAHTKDQLKQSLSEMSAQLKLKQTSKDYTEKELNTWVQRLDKLRQKFENSLSIDINEDDTQSIVHKIEFLRKSAIEKHSTISTTATQPRTSSSVTSSGE